MGEAYPAGQALAAPAMDARATREALLAAGSMLELDAALQRAADVLARRFGADFSLVHVRRPGQSNFTSPVGLVGTRDLAWWADAAALDDFETPGIGGNFGGAGTAAFEGIRSTMRLGLRGERGQLIGFLLLGSRKPGYFDERHLSELLELGPAASSWIRPAVLVELLRREHELIEVEAELLAEAASADTEATLIKAVAEGVRRGLRADLAFIHVHVANPAFPGATLHCSPSNALNAGQWSEAYRTMQSPGNMPLSAEQQDGSRVNPDLSTYAPTPIETFLRDSCGMRSLLTSVRSHRWGGLGLGLSAARTAPGPWSRAERAFLARLSRVLEISVERLRRGELAIAHAVSLERQTELLATGEELLATLSETPDLEEACNRISVRIRELFGADHVAFGTIDAENRQREWLGISSDVFRREETSTDIGDADIAAFGRALGGKLEVIQDLGQVQDLNPTTAILRDNGFLSLIRAPFRLSDGAVGVVTVAARERARYADEDAERLEDLCGPIGIAIDRVRLLARMAESSRMLQQQSHRTQAVLDVLTALGPRETLEDVAGPIAAALRTMYGADHCAIGVIEGARVRIAGVDSSIVPWSQGDSSPAEAVFGDGNPRTAVLHVIEDLSAPLEEPTSASEEARSGGMRASMRVLIGTPADVLGVVTVGSRTAGRYSEEDARQLAQIVQPLGVVMRYFQSRGDAVRRTNRLETTNRILTRLSAGGTPEHLAKGFLAECRQLFEAGHAGVLSFDHEAGTGIELASDSTVARTQSARATFSLADLHSARLVREPLPHIVGDAREEAPLHERHRELIAAGLYSVMRAPLVVQDTVRGAVVLWAEGADRFTVEDAELLGTLTRPLALALEKAAALESLGESELKYRSLVAQAEEMIFLFDSLTHRILDANSYTARALDYEPAALQQLRFDDIAGENPEELDRQLKSLFADGELRVSDSVYRRRDGTFIDVDIVASLVTYGGRQAVLVLARDVSERKALIGQLLQSQKMDSLGAMAGAVAHDFNNLLTTILGFAGLLKRSMNMDSEERENLALIEDAARRAADLTGRLLSFSRGGLVRFGRVDLRDVVSDTMQLAEPTMHDRVQVTVSVPAMPVHVEGDGGQLQQALTNIVLNARDAMPEGGAIDIALRMDGEVAVIVISDTGPGMNEEVRMRIFEPFYTTKPVGSGTGLGMAITYGIIQGHHGDITVQSARGRGTTFTISLPVLMGTQDGLDGDVYNAGDGNLVLVVDDDPMVRRTTTATLAELGYNVVEAPGGSTAVEIVRARPDRFSAVLLDLVMPGMTGSETFRALTAIRPDLPVVVCTGYAADSHIDTDVKRRIAGLVQKPFTAERLGRALEAAGAKPTTTPRI